jgi:hypothetical protein
VDKISKGKAKGTWKNQAPITTKHLQLHYGRKYKHFIAKGTW